MDTGTFWVSLATLVSVIITGIIEFYNSVKRKDLEVLKNKNEQLRHNLKELYLDVQQLLEIEENLTKELETSKKIVRKPYTLSRRIQPKNVEKMIRELSE